MNIQKSIKKQKEYTKYLKNKHTKRKATIQSVDKIKEISEIIYKYLSERNIKKTLDNVDVLSRYVCSQTPDSFKEMINKDLMYFKVKGYTDPFDCLKDMIKETVFNEESLLIRKRPSGRK